MAEADVRAVREAHQARWGALWAGAATVGAIAWVLSGLPQTRAPDDALEDAAARASAEAPASRNALPAPAVPVSAPVPPAAIAPLPRVQPVTLEQRLVQPAPRPRMAQTARARVPATRANQGARVRGRALRCRPAAQRQAERPHPSEDARIRTQVAERLTANPGISGRIAIDSRGSVVYLSGYTLTAAQAQRAEREARRVRGVRGVRNEIRARVGGSY